MNYNLIHGSKEEHMTTLQRAKQNNISYVWSGELRNPYLLENLYFGKELGLIDIEFFEDYEGQESGYKIKYLD